MDLVCQSASNSLRAAQWLRLASAEPEHETRSLSAVSYVLDCSKYSVVDRLKACRVCENTGPVTMGARAIFEVPMRIQYRVSFCKTANLFCGSSTGSSFSMEYRQTARAGPTNFRSRDLPCQRRSVSTRSSRAEVLNYQATHLGVPADSVHDEYDNESGMILLPWPVLSLLLLMLLLMLLLPLLPQLASVAAAVATGYWLWSIIAKAANSATSVGTTLLFGVVVKTGANVASNPPQCLLEFLM